MRLPVDARFALTIVGSAALAGCGVMGGGDDRPALAASDAATRSGPAADYPIVLGNPYTVDGELYTPDDTLNMDEVGYAAIDQGAGISAAHKTMPLPSYAEITSLDSGRTILVRVERRGPMTGARVVALSAGAQAQLGIADGAPVRVRRVNPPEVERAELRAGRPAPLRMETPPALVQVLKRKLPSQGSIPVRSANAPTPAPGLPPVTGPRPVESVAVRPSAAARPEPVPAPAARPKAVSAYPLVPLAGAKPAQTSPSTPARNAGLVVQAAAFTNEANAVRAAAAIGGFVTRDGRFWHVRTGPYTSRSDAEAALAKVRAAGYSDARVFTSI